jgi:peptidoglycan hydrolase CwlO-like protein
MSKEERVIILVQNLVSYDTLIKSTTYSLETKEDDLSYLIKEIDTQRKQLEEYKKEREEILAKLAAAGLESKE